MTPRCLPISTAGAGLAVVAALTLVVLTSSSAPADDHCPAPGGEKIPLVAEPEEGKFVFAGRGWGHGVGLSQYGAQGAALLGCTAEQILDAYFTGTEIGQVTPPGDGIRVGVVPNHHTNHPVARYQVTNTGQSTVPLELRDADGAAVGELEMAAGAVWRIERADGDFEVREQDGSSWRELDHDQDLDGATRLAAVLDSTDGRQVTLANNRPYRRGEVHFSAHGSDRFAVQAELDSIEEYLLGVDEVPGWFEPAAQEAQAITARAFAYIKRGDGRYANCDCHIYDSTSDQVWRGSASEFPRWVTAVGATEDQVLRYGGSPVSTNYASSHGGHSESAQFVWGGTGSPHQQAVDDSRWDLASNNPHRTWELKLTPEEAGARLDVGTLLSIELPEPRGAGGRIGHPARGYGGAIVEGVDRTRTLSGEQLRSLLGTNQMRSSLFTVANPPEEVLSARLEGHDRYETAANIALSAFGAETGTVYLATGTAYADALAGGPAAVAEDAALLLTQRDVLPDATRDALVKLEPEQIVVLGGPLAVNDDLVADLERFADVVERRYGADRMATAAAIATGAFDDTATEAFVATGRDFADALAGGVVAATRGGPVLLVEPDELPDATRQALTDLGIEDITVLGGPNAVSEAVFEELRGTVIGEVTRQGGQNRFDTATRIAGMLGGAESAYLATGRTFPDALAAVPVAAIHAAPIVMVEPRGALPAEAEAYLGELAPALLTALGGENAVAPAVLDAAVRAARG